MGMPPGLRPRRSLKYLPLKDLCAWVWHRPAMTNFVRRNDEFTLRYISGGKDVFGERRQISCSNAHLPMAGGVFDRYVRSIPLASAQGAFPRWAPGAQPKR